MAFSQKTKGEKPALNGESLDQLLEQTKLSQAQKDKFLLDLETQLRIDNHDFGVAERLEIVSTCFDKTISTVIMQIPEPNELHAFKTCVRKFSRVKMRSLQYYHGTLHAHEDYLYKNLRMLRPFMCPLPAESPNQQ